MSETVAERVLMQRFQEANVVFRTTWDLYLKFYTVFLTFDLAALAWVNGKPFQLAFEAPSPWRSSVRTYLSPSRAAGWCAIRRKLRPES